MAGIAAALAQAGEPIHLGHGVLATSRGNNNSGAPVNKSCEAYSQLTTCLGYLDPVDCLTCGITNYSGVNTGGTGYDTPQGGAGYCGDVYSGYCFDVLDCVITTDLNRLCDRPPGVPPAEQ
jgi:hypothetical protein